jgi:hypothetical protein
MMKRHPTPMRCQRTAIPAALAFLGGAFLLSQGCAPRPEKMTAGKFPEQLVYVRSEDDIVNGGAIFTPPKNSAKPVAIIWIHGWGTNFYEPIYIAIGRVLAERGYTCITGTRAWEINGSAAAVIGV